MKYKLMYHPNPECLTVNVNVELTNEMIELFDSIKYASGKNKKFVEELFGIAGVTGVSLHKYELGITKGSVFEWEDIIQEVIMIILLHYCPNEKAVEIAKPQKHTISNKGFSKSEDMKDSKLNEYSLPDVNKLIK